jgi:predicted NBD/HSP70 family sugar kinase
MRNADRPGPNTPGADDLRIVELVARREANTRPALARALGYAPSTVSLRVQSLIDRGLLQERGVAPSAAGRRARVLEVRGSRGYVLSADLGGEHARIGVVDFGGVLEKAVDARIHIEQGPEPTLRAVATEMRRLAAQGDDEDLAGLRAVGIALPGPVVDGRIDQPSRMPGWAGFPVGDWLTAEFGVPAFVGNDANMMALGEHRARFAASTGSSITVKAGTAIGTGVVIEGSLLRGATGAAGELTHTRVAAAGRRVCSCGNVGCLESIASGAALARDLRELGFDVTTTAEVLDLARDAEPQATGLLRAAGLSLGDIVAGVVNALNPDAVFLGGSMSASETFLAAARSRIYESCHPLTTQRLRIEAAVTGRDGGMLGASRLALEGVSAADHLTNEKDS